MEQESVIKASAQAAVSSEGWTEGGPTSKFMWLFDLKKKFFFQFY